MERFRYRTAVLVGPWRDRIEQASADAVRAGQARLEPPGSELIWTVPGRIESTAEGRQGGGTPDRSDPSGPD